jgi:glutathione S-transferase
MELYFSPLACSMATRISLYEAGIEATYFEVDSKTKRTRDGRDFRQINPLGLVPAIRTDTGEVLTENAAILQYVAGRAPSGALAPTTDWERARLQQWLCFVGTELHKALFGPLLDPNAPDGAKAYALEKGMAGLEMLDAYLTTREFLLDEFSAADAYLATVLGWAVVTPVQLSKFPGISAYLKRLYARPSVARAFTEERSLYLEEQARRATI